MYRDEMIAFCYLKVQNDEKNKVELSQHQLLVTHKGKPAVFSLEHVSSIHFSQKKWLFPLVIGGITAPFMLIAIFLNLYNPWPLFLVFVVAFLVFYIGWTLHPALTIQEKSTEYHFFLPDISDNLKAFVAFANRYRYNMTTEIFHVARLRDWQRAQPEQRYQCGSLQKQGFIHACTASQLSRLKNDNVFSKKEQWVILTMDLLKLEAEVRFEAADEPAGSKRELHELFPHIYGPVNVDAVVSVNPLYQQSQSF